MIRELGRGGLGVVVLARHVRLDRQCAVKRVLAAPAAGSEAEDRFRREARALARLDHPAVVRLYDVAAADGRLYVVMEFVEGFTFRRLIDHEAIDPVAAAIVLGDVAAALAHAASRGVVHRDVKPANVFVLPDGRAKLGDFGIARVLGDTATFRSATGTALGSAAYMAPEQILGDALIGPSADVYAFSVMAYEVTVGRLPFPALSLEQLIDAHLHGTPDRPDAVLDGYPSALGDALVAGMAKDPAKRPPIQVIAAALGSVAPLDWPVPPRVAPRVVHPDHEGTSTETVAGGVHPPEGDVAPVEATQVPGVDTGPGAKPVPKGHVPSDTWIDLPVYRPGQPAPSGRRWRSVTLAAVVVVGVVGAAWVLISSHLGAEAGTSLEVESASVEIPPEDTQLSCPEATFTFTGRLRSNGQAGTIRMKWTGPDGVTQPPISVQVDAGSTEVQTVLRFVVSGTSELTGSATLQVLVPSSLTATGPGVVYSCP